MSVHLKTLDNLMDVIRGLNIGGFHKRSGVRPNTGKRLAISTPTAPRQGSLTPAGYIPIASARGGRTHGDNLVYLT